VDALRAGKKLIFNGSFTVKYRSTDTTQNFNMSTFEEELEEYLMLRAASDRKEDMSLEKMRRFWRLGSIPGILGAAWRLKEEEE